MNAENFAELLKELGVNSVSEVIFYRLMKK